MCASLCDQISPARLKRFSLTVPKSMMRPPAIAHHRKKLHNNADKTGQPSFLMLNNMAMERPVAGVVSHKRDIHDLSLSQQHRVRPVGRQRAFVRQDRPKYQPVQMYRVVIWAFVAQAQNDTFP